MKKNTIRAFGYEWTNAMEGGRIFTSQHPWQWYDPSQVTSHYNGMVLRIENIPKEIVYKNNTYHPTLAVAVMRSVNTFLYGEFTADIFLPHGSHLWPSFWMVGEGHWPENGEIDIMESWSNGKGSYFRATIPQFPYLVPSWDVTTNVHHSDGSVGSKMLPLCKYAKNPSERFMRYGVRWTEDAIDFTLDGKIIRKVRGKAVEALRNHPQHVVFDCWADSASAVMETPMIVANFKHEEL